MVAGVVLSADRMPPRHSVGLNATPPHGGRPSSAGSGVTSRQSPSRQCERDTAVKRAPVRGVVNASNIATRIAAAKTAEERAAIVAAQSRPGLGFYTMGRAAYVTSDPRLRTVGLRELHDPASSSSLWGHLRRGTPQLNAATPADLPLDIRRPVEGPGAYVRRVDPRTLELHRSNLPLGMSTTAADAVFPVSRIRRVPPPPPQAQPEIRHVGRARNLQRQNQILQPSTEPVEGCRTARKHVVTTQTKPDAGTVRSGRAHTPVDRCPDAGPPLGAPSHRRRAHSAESSANDPFAVPGDAGYVDGTPRGRRRLSDIQAHFDRQPDNPISSMSDARRARYERLLQIRPRDSDIFPNTYAGSTGTSTPRSSGAPTRIVLPRDDPGLLRWGTLPATAPRRAPPPPCDTATSKPSALSPSAYRRTHDPSGLGGFASRPNAPPRGDPGSTAAAGDSTPAQVTSPFRYRRADDPSGLLGFRLRPGAMPRSADTGAETPPQRVSPQRYRRPNDPSGLIGFRARSVSPAGSDAERTPRARSPTHMSSGVALAFSWVT